MDPEIDSELVARLLTNYFQVSVASLFVCDYLYNLEDEITLVWKEKRWGLDKVLFVLVRYSPLAMFPLSLSAALSTYVNVDSCVPLFFASITLRLIGITSSECIFNFFGYKRRTHANEVLAGIFALRCYAIWNSHRVILIIACFTSAASVTSLIVILARYLPLVKFIEPPFPIHGCYNKSVVGSDIFVCYIVIMVSEAIILSLTLYRVRKFFCDTPSALIQSLVCDGVTYCLIVFAMSLANILVVFILPIEYSDMLGTYEAVVQTILASWMQLHLRKVDRHIRTGGPPVAPLPPMTFSTGVHLPDV
ncbi:hypothetical protein BV22DRAFT_1133254 [Leucogyrophana mollusca]|uniref:Uncharacterized protein n=1 Tax=Leucogyrophana mollusca TaxID=85980 RepID=A0ACB8B457_9AGAM|nr:hypothetical protein BV22DRAFT_1133254 [Leucogyrophana mollusca]